MQITSSPTREKYPLSYKKITKKTFVSVIGWSFFFCFIMFFFFIAGVGIILDGEDPSLIIILGVFLLSSFVISTIIIAVLSYLYQSWYFAVYFYDIMHDYLVIKKGPITPKEITIPWERIQDVYVDQDIFDRIFGLYDVHLSTATFTSGMQAHIDGVEKEAADGLREELLEKIKNRISKK